MEVGFAAAATCACCGIRHWQQLLLWPQRTRQPLTMHRGKRLPQTCAPALQVERFFIDGGWLFPKKHIQYWIGLRQRAGNRWNFTDITITSPSFRTYSHWGTNVPSNTSEPNNYFGNERCGVANATEEFDGAWGWADHSCNQTFVHVCRIMRGWLRGCCRGQTRPCRLLWTSISMPSPTACRWLCTNQPATLALALTQLFTSLRLAWCCSNTAAVGHHQLTRRMPLPLRLPAAPGNFSYSSNTSNLTYVLSTYNRTFADANSQCRLEGGSLATYRSLALQLEVEKYYIDQGLLFPFYHRVGCCCLLPRAPWAVGVGSARAADRALHLQPLLCRRNNQQQPRSAATSAPTHLRPCGQF
jgi:hypothetical protein